MARNLEGRCALVTGSTSGIGLAIAEALAAQGARVAVTGLGEQAEIDAALKRVEDAGAAEAKFFPGNLLDVEALETLMAETAAWGPVDILVNNAGMQITAPLAEQGRNWDKVIGLNLTACFHTMRLAMPGMRARGFGRVLNIASVHGLVASVEKVPYVASKFGLVGMTKVAALEFAADGSRDTGGVTVNAICPGWVETPLIEPQIMARAEKHGGDRAAGVVDLVSEKQPSGRLSTPADLAALAAFLCSDAAHNITGQALAMDGGWTAQ